MSPAETDRRQPCAAVVQSLRATKNSPLASRPEVVMRAYFLAAGTLLVSGLALFAVEKDTALAANTRAKKLTAKVTVDFKDEILDECIKELSRQIDDAGGGRR